MIFVILDIFFADLTIQIDAYTLHRDPSVWGKNAEEFEPERFETEANKKRHPMAWIPFGAGPRNCIGKRFALMELKLTLCRILQRFEFERAVDTEVIIT